MRIMFISMATSSHTIKWVNYFRDQGNEIMLVSFYPAMEKIKGIDFRCIKCRNKNTAIFKVFQVKKLIKQFKPQILHAHYATSCGMVAALTGFHPFVLSTWGDDIFDFPNKSPIHKWLVSKTILKADYITATSHMLAKQTRALIDNKKDVKVIPFGVNTQHFEFAERQPGKEIVIGTVRNLRVKYGLKYLIEAFGILSKSYNNIKLSIVGDGYLRPDLEYQVKNLGLDNIVNFEGFIPSENVVEYMNRFDIFVIPSVGQGETFGVAAVEAMSTGLPVVASNIGGLIEVVDDGKTGILVKPGDTDDLRKALEYYINNKDPRIKHGRAGRKKVEEQYNWQDNAAMMNKLYLKIVNGKD